jgi:hypothetical protein
MSDPIAIVGGIFALIGIAVALYAHYTDKKAKPHH